MGIEERLEHDLRLSHLINAESLGNLCASFSDLHGVPIVALDADARPLAGALDLALPGLDARHKTALAAGPGGASYRVVRVDNQFDPVGFLVFGRAGPLSLRPGALVDDRVARLLCTVVEEIVYANFQSYLVSKMTLQAQARGLGELLDKEKELHQYAETLQRSKDLRSMF